LIVSKGQSKLAVIQRQSMRFRKIPVWFMPFCLVAGGAGRAQEALNPPAPLTVRAAGTTVSPGGGVVTREAAQRALELGFPSVAAGIYRQLLAATEAAGAPPAGADRGDLLLAWATALLDDGQPAEAEKVLGEWVGGRGSAWHLRAGLAAVQLKKVDVARGELAAIRVEELSAADRAWASFLQGALFDLAPVQDVTKANEFYISAEKAAANETARARFRLAGEQVRLGLGKPSEAAVRQARANYEQFRGRAVGDGFAKPLAVMLHLAGRTAEAVTFLQQTIQTLLPQERVRGDELRLLLGMIADQAPGGIGRVALNQLVATGSNPDRQREALQLLARASQPDNVRGVFRAELNRLVDAPVKHPILESLLLFRAQVALAEKEYAPAERDARRLLDEYPGSPYRVHAFGVLTAAAWEQRRYRAAADHARKARAALAPGPAQTDTEAAVQARAELVVLEAEAWFRAGSAGDAGDFRSAADAYAAALRERPAGLRAGDLMFQRVLSEIKAGAVEAAQPLLDELGRDPEFDLENRWRAEWTLARALQVQGPAGVKQAYARVNALLAERRGDGPVAALPVELRARMAWLQARLALDAGEPERTLQLADEMTALLGGVDEKLRNEIASTGALAKAEANFALKREAAALATLKTLREDPKFGKSDAAVQSYLIEAGHLAAQEKTVDAQKLLTRLADEFPQNELAPYALYQAALQAERRGQDANYKEANRLIEDLVKKYPQSDLVFSARLKQGDLLRNLNDLPAAQHSYEDLLNKPASQENLILAQLALAECHNAQSSGDPSHFDRAQTLFEQLRDRVDAPVDVRVEAGYNLGELWVRRDNRAKALEVWWNDVVNPFLLDARRAGELQTKGRYWMARTLYRAGEVFEQQEKLEEAKEAWLLLLKTKLGWGEALAKAKLARFGPVEAKP
jgi:TolA-binding protein